MRILLLIGLVLFSPFLQAKVNKNAKVVGEVTSIVGSVRVKHDGSFRKKIIKKGNAIKEGDLLTTSKKSSLVMHLSDKSVIALDENAAIYFGKNNMIDQKQGKVYYKIVSRDAKHALDIKTPFAIMGIKGTTFVIHGKKNGLLTLKEGLIGVRSSEKEFQLYIKTQKEEFDQYFKGEQTEFKKYEEEGASYVVTSTKEFDLKSGKRVSFMGKKVKEEKLKKNDNEEFTYFEKLVHLKK